MFRLQLFTTEAKQGCILWHTKTAGRKAGKCGHDRFTVPVRDSSSCCSLAVHLDHTPRHGPASSSVRSAPGLTNVIPPAAIHMAPTDVSTQGNNNVGHSPGSSLAGTLVPQASQDSGAQAAPETMNYPSNQKLCTGQGLSGYGQSMLQDAQRMRFAQALIEESLSSTERSWSYLHYGRLTWNYQDYRLYLRSVLYYFNQHQKDALRNLWQHLGFEWIACLLASCPTAGRTTTPSATHAC
ncbi:hypothetical protein ABBQ32_010692 [Trebouxia sp. C0010 RCD-2024]